jgi:DNA-directed RNA polymerase subunit omega
MKLIEGFDSNYRYILVAARRARQLQSGAPPVVDTNSRKPCRIAQDEIRAGKVKWEIPETSTKRSARTERRIVDFAVESQSLHAQSIITVSH